MKILVASTLISVILFALAAFLLPQALPSETPTLEITPSLETIAHSSSSVAAVTPSITPQQKNTPKKTAAPATHTAPEKASATTTQPTDKNEVVRVQAPYQIPPLAAGILNERARASLVNILCTTPSSTFNPVSGSGIVIKENLILTNAHVAQYVLLQDTTRIDITCVVRAGSPARPVGTARVAFIPRTWATRHAGDILSPLAKSTGEYDVALVSIEQPKEAVPPIAFDTREAVAFTGDTVLIAGYPASFLGGILIQKSLSAVSAFTTIPEVLTFSESLVDAVSLGKTVLAQQGSSGGGVFNQHGYLVGLIATATLGKTTDDRELRAITLAHINRTFRSEVGMSIEEYLSQGSSEELRTLFAPTARALVPLFLPALNLSTTSALL